jgi:hypothetical protein
LSQIKDHHFGTDSWIFVLAKEREEAKGNLGEERESRAKDEILQYPRVSIINHN